MTTGENIPTPMKAQVDPAAWARKLAASSKRQWSQVEALLAGLEPTIDQVRETMDADIDLASMENVLDALGSLYDEMSQVGLLVTPEQAAAFHVAKDALLEVIPTNDLTPEDLVTAYEDIGEALEARTSAEFETGSERADGLSAAWDDVVEALDRLADALEGLAPS